MVFSAVLIIIMLEDGGRDFLATHAGSGTPKCYQPSGIPFHDTDGLPQTGSTGDVAGMLSIAKDEEYTGVIVDGLTYADFRVANGGNDISVADVGWVYANDGGAAEPQYCLGVTPTPIPETPTPTPPPVGKATLWLATDPGCCAAWIDCDHAVESASVACTQDATKGLYDKMEVSAPATHFIHIKKTGFENFYDDNRGAVLLEGDNWYVMPSLTAIAGANVALLTVNAYKHEEPHEPPAARLAVENAVVKKGTKIMGFVPYSDYWGAEEVGTVYDLSVVADGRETYEQKITLIKDTPKTINAFMPVKKLEIKIRIAPGVAYIDDISGGDYQTWYIGTRVEGWVRAETFLETPTMFKAELSFCTLGTETPVSGISKIITEEKLLHPAMTATERHLDWPPWLVPDKPGKYSLLSELFYLV